MPAYPAFCDGSYQAQSPVTSQTTLVNWYTELSPADQGATSRKSLYPTPGVDPFVTVTQASGGRAMYNTGAGRTFGVVGNRLIEVFQNQTYLVRGSIAMAVDENPATIVTNGVGGDQLFVTSGGKGYCYDLLTNTLTEIADLVATQGGMLYGYFTAFNKPNAQMRISDLFDGSVWDPTQFYENSITSDNSLGMCVTSYGQICLAGSKNGQFLYNSGAFPFPFAPDPSALFQKGVAATFSMKEVSGGVAWLATSAQGGYSVVFASGYSPERISDHALEKIIDDYARVDDAIGDAYDDEGHVFYILTFPSADATWVYDFSTKQWARRGTWISEENAYTYWRPVFHCFSFEKHLVADRETGVIYDMSHVFGRDVDDRPIRRVRRCPAINNEHLRLRYSRFEILVQAGLGSADEAPLLMMRMSRDFGQTWGNELMTSLGKMGQYEVRPLFWRVGQARGRVFEISTTADTPVRITDAYLRILPSTEAA